MNVKKKILTPLPSVQSEVPKKLPPVVRMEDLEEGQKRNGRPGRKTNRPPSKAFEVPKTHGHTVNGGITPTYSSWIGMWGRCSYPGCKSYERYGGRGIKICERWEKFDNFLADMGERPMGLQLDRIDPNGDYNPSNCRWVTAIQNARNRTDNRWAIVDGKRMTIAEASEILNVNQTTINMRLSTIGDDLVDLKSIKFTPVITLSQEIVNLICKDSSGSTTASRKFGISESQILRIRKGEYRIKPTL